MILTDRDERVLDVLYHFSFLTREQIELLLFSPERGQRHLTKTSICRKRLKLLYQHGFVERLPVPLSSGQLGFLPVYRLTKRGFVEVAAVDDTLRTESLTKSMELSWKRLSDKVSLFFLEHTLRTNDVRVAFILAAQARGYQIETWLNESELKADHAQDYAYVGDLKVAIVPDAYFVLNLGNRRAHFFLELDRGTMTLRRWKTRVRAYQAYIDSGKYQKRYQTQSLRILTVTTTQARLESLKQATAQVGARSIFWFSTLDQATADKVTSMPIWSLPGEDTSPKMLVV